MNWSQPYAGAEQERRVSAAPAAPELGRYGQLLSGNLTKNRLNPTSQGPDSWHKKFNSRLVAPTFLRNEPFGDNVEGLSHFGARTASLSR